MGTGPCGKFPGNFGGGGNGGDLGVPLLMGGVVLLVRGGSVLFRGGSFTLGKVSSIGRSPLLGGVPSAGMFSLIAEAVLFEGRSLFFRGSLLFGGEGFIHWRFLCYVGWSLLLGGPNLGGGSMLLGLSLLLGEGVHPIGVGSLFFK